MEMYEAELFTDRKKVGTVSSVTFRGLKAAASRILNGYVSERNRMRVSLRFDNGNVISADLYRKNRIKDNQIAFGKWA